MSSTSAVDTSIQTVSGALGSGDCTIMAERSGVNLIRRSHLPAYHTLYLLAHIVKQFVLDVHESRSEIHYFGSIMTQCS